MKDMPVRSLPQAYSKVQWWGRGGSLTYCLGGQGHSYFIVTGIRYDVVRIFQKSYPRLIKFAHHQVTKVCTRYRQAYEYHRLTKHADMCRQNEAYSVPLEQLLLPTPGGIILSRSFYIGSFPSSHSSHYRYFFSNICRTFFVMQAYMGIVLFCSGISLQRCLGFCFQTGELCEIWWSLKCYSLPR